MKFFANKKTTQKIVIAILLIMSLNFIVPKPVQALGAAADLAGDIGGFIFDPFIALLTTIVDAVFNGVQDFMLGRDGDLLFMVDRNSTSEYYGPQDGAVPVTLEKDKYDGAYWGIGEYKIPMIKYSPEAIFSNKVPVLDANFLKSDMRALPGETGKNTMQSLRDVIAGWYVAIRTLAIVGLLSVLVYLAIRMMISGVAADKAKYKKMFMDWLIAMCLLFFMHYIMSFAQTVSETMVSMISSAGETAINVNVGGGETQFSTNMIGLVRFQVQHIDSIPRVTYFILYVMMVFYTVKFTWVYLKRMITMAFLTLIAPLAALTYPIDKVGDGKAQAFDMWLKEYIYNTLVQPLHCLIYTVFSAATIQIAATNPLLAIVIFPCLSYAEKFLKQMLGFNKAGGGTLPSMAGAVGAGALTAAVSNIGKLGKGGGKSAPDKVRTADNNATKRSRDREAPKGVQGFIEAASSGEALNYADEEVTPTDRTDNRDDNPDGNQLPEGNQQNGNQEQNPELEAHQREWKEKQKQEYIDILNNAGAYPAEVAIAAQEELAALMAEDADAEPQPDSNDGDQEVSLNETGAGAGAGAGAQQPNSNGIRTPRPILREPDTRERKTGGKVIKGAKGVGAVLGKTAYVGTKGAAKMLAKGAIATGVGALTFAAGSVLTGDISKGAALAGAAAAGSYGLAGKIGDATLGKVTEKFEDAVGISGGTGFDGIKQTYDRQRYGGAIKAQNARADKEFAKSKELADFLEDQYDTKEERAAAKKAIMEYRTAGIDYVTANKAYKLENKINNGDRTNIGGRKVTREEMISTLQTYNSGGINTRAYSDDKVYKREQKNISNLLAREKGRNGEALDQRQRDTEAKRILELTHMWHQQNKM